MTLQAACIRPSDFTRPDDGATYTEVLEEITDGYGLDVSFDDYRPHEGELPNPEDKYDAVVVTGSGAHVYDRQDWVEETERYLEQALSPEDGTGTPVLGICYGHQILADTLGADDVQTVQALADSDDVPGDREMGYREITLTSDGLEHPLFDGVVEEGEDTLVSFESHQDYVAELPEDTELLAENEYGVQAYAAEDVPAYGVQFHPEYDLSMAKELLDGKAMADAEKAEVRATFTEENVAAAEASGDVIRNFFQEL